MTDTDQRCHGADDPEERCPLHPRDCACWQVDLNHPTVGTPMTIETELPAVKVKALEWEEIHYNRSNEEPIPELTGWYAETEVGSYYVMLEARIEVTLDGFQFHKVGSFDEPDPAFAAAQADYERRILSALVPSDSLKELGKGDGR